MSDGVEYRLLIVEKRERFWFFSSSKPVEVVGKGSCPQNRSIRSLDDGSDYEYEELKETLSKARKLKTYECVNDNGEVIKTATSESRWAAKRFLRYFCHGKIRRSKTYVEIS